MENNVSAATATLGLDGVVLLAVSAEAGELRAGHRDHCGRGLLPRLRRAGPVAQPAPDVGCGIDWHTQTTNTDQRPATTLAA